MDVRRFLQWAETAPAEARIEAVRPLVQAYARGDIRADRGEPADLALTALLDDPCADVRRVLAECVAHSVDVPRHLVAALAQEPSCIALPVLRRSPLLSDADLVDAVAVGDAAAQGAIAMRPSVSGAVVAALAEVGDRTALIALCHNPQADLQACSIRRMLARFGGDGALREALLARDDIDADLRHDLVVATAQALTAFATSCAWMTSERAERVQREARDKAAVTIAARSAAGHDPEAPRRLVIHLRAVGHLTPALILRSLLSGHVGLCAAALAELSGIDPDRVAGHLRAPGGSGFSALFRRAGLPAVLLLPFRAALVALQARHQPPGDGLCRPIIIATLRACDAGDDPDLGKVAALLRRFEAEAAREEARLIPLLLSGEEAEEARDLAWMPRQPAPSRLGLQTALLPQ